MEANKPLAHAFDDYADRYADVINAGARASGESYEYMVNLRLGLFMRQIAGQTTKLPRPVLLDFGCGTGYTIEQLATRVPGALLHGFDTSLDSVAVATGRKVPGAEFHCRESWPLPFADSCFDAIYSNGTFHHIPADQHENWLRQLFRVLRGGGKIVIFENNPLNPLMMQAMRRTPFDAGATPVRAGDLSSALAEAGFQSRRPRYYFFFPRWLKWLRSTEKLLTGVPLGAQYYLSAEKPAV